VKRGFVDLTSGIVATKLDLFVEDALSNKLECSSITCFKDLSNAKISE
jgi:hypothetical protein